MLDGNNHNSKRYFLKEIRDPQGRALMFYYKYEENQSALGQLLLHQIVNLNGQRTKFFYDSNARPGNRTREIVGPFNRKAILGYTGDQLPSITNAAGIVSGIKDNGNTPKRLPCLMARPSLKLKKQRPKPCLGERS
ncbi:MAG: hypothetical protein M2R45_04911 [Verrucomicrobia subdivision 3 bacterium]|nr:hypothetical protein [Limisphaerales bacterium]MCS1417563.1 hypothetical protein [Limisphaerales bacterium]